MLREVIGLNMRSFFADEGENVIWTVCVGGAEADGAMRRYGVSPSMSGPTGTREGTRSVCLLEVKLRIVIHTHDGAV